MVAYAVQVQWCARCLDPPVESCAAWPCFWCLQLADQLSRIARISYRIWSEVCGQPTRGAALGSANHVHPNLGGSSERTCCSPTPLSHQEGCSLDTQETLIEPRNQPWLLSSPLSRFLTTKPLWFPALTSLCHTVTWQASRATSKHCSPAHHPCTH